MKPVWYYELGALRVRFDGFEVICPDVGLSLKRMVELTIQHCIDADYIFSESLL